MAVNSSTNATIGSSNTNKVVFVFVPGSFHTTDYLQPIRDHLCDKGFESVAIGHKTMELATTAADTGTLHDDATKVEEVVARLLNEGKNVLLVMHSYGGITGTQAIGHLLSENKSAAGPRDAHSNTGKVVGLVYVSACVPVEGETMQEMHKSSAAAVQEDTNGFDMLSTIEMVDGKVALKEEIKEAFYHDLPESLRDWYYGLLGSMPATVLAGGTTVTHVGWQHVQSTFVYAMEDRVLSPKYQRSWVTRADEVLAAQKAGTHGGRDTPGRFLTADIDSDHCSMFILPKHVKKLGEILMTTCL